MKSLESFLKIFSSFFDTMLFLFLQAEIRRMKEVHKAACEERKFMLQQQKDIQRMKKSTQKIWNQVGNYDQTTEKSDSSVSFSDLLNLITINH